MNEVRKYRKKPIVIDAIQWDGSRDVYNALQYWGAPVTFMPATNYTGLIIGTLEDGPNSEAIHVASLNDWIVKGIKGEFYPVKPDIFAETYDLES